MERTLALVKPDGVERCLIGEVIAHYERKGLHIADIKMLFLLENWWKNITKNIKEKIFLMS